MTNPTNTAGEMGELQRRFILATPLQQPSDAGVIAYRAGVTTGGGAFAMFARKNPKLFERIMNGYGTAWTYRLSDFGRQVRDCIAPNSLNTGD